MTRHQLRVSLAYWRRAEKYAKRKHSAYQRKLVKARDRDAGRQEIARLERLRDKWSERLKRCRSFVELRQRQLRTHEDHKWGGSRHYTNRVIDIVNGRAPVTSRKRWALFGNPGSDHYRGNRTADAVDFGVANAHSLKNEISSKLGGPASLPDFGTFLTAHNGRTYRHQAIAATHGTGPHLHWGVRRVS